MIDEVEQFWMRQARLPEPRYRVIVCLVCNRTVTQHPTRAGLCQHCGDDLPTARAHVVGIVLATEARIERAHDAYEQAAAQCPDRIAAYHAARLAGDSRADQVDNLARTDRADALLDAVRAWHAYQTLEPVVLRLATWQAQCAEALS